MWVIYSIVLAYMLYQSIYFIYPFMNLLATASG